MRITRGFDVSNLKAGNEDFNRFVSDLLSSIITIINGEISFSDNFKACILTVKFTAANTQQLINHTLNKLPTGFINIGSIAATNVYKGGTVNTTQFIYLQSSVATTVTLLIF